MDSSDRKDESKDDNNKLIMDMLESVDIADIQQEIEGNLSLQNTKVSELPQPSNDWLMTTTSHASTFYRETIKNQPQKPRQHNPWFKRAVAIVLAATIGMGSLGIGLGAGFAFITQQSSAVADENAIYNPHEATFTSSRPSFSDESLYANTLADIVEAVQHSVVAITARIPGQGGSIIERHGSGVIFAEDETRVFIVTNYYVVRGAGERVAVSVAGSDTIFGRPIGTDTTADIAVLYVLKTDLIEVGVDSIVIATFGDSDQMRQGHTVLTIGNVMGSGNAVTRGILSSENQAVVLPTGGHTLPLLQIDAAMNYGNSGGPLINTRGEVIGININQASSLIFGISARESINFSIASNIVTPILDDIINNRRPALGILGGTLTAEIAAELDIPPFGVLVSQAVPGRAAYRGGMQDGDVITGFNGLPVFNWQQLVYAIRSSRIGEDVEVRVLRYGTTAITLYIQLDTMVIDSF